MATPAKTQTQTDNDKDERKPVVVKVTPETHRNLKVAAALEDTTVQKLVAGLLDKLAADSVAKLTSGK